jgi:hypothetical protein
VAQLCPRALGSLSVASYDSHGCGGGILSRLHTGSYAMGIGTFSPGVKRQEREANHSPETCAQVKKTWTYTATPPYVFMA